MDFGSSENAGEANLHLLFVVLKSLDNYGHFVGFLIGLSAKVFVKVSNF